MEQYVIRGGRAGADRLQVLARQWAPTTAALLDRVGVVTGARCLDLGCGAGDVTLEFARRVGTTGRVTAVDMDAEKLAVTRERVDAAGFDNVDVVQSDVYVYAPAEPFDLVYCRNLLQHLSRPVDVLRAMWSAVAPGGVLAVEDADFEGSFCYPPDPAFDFWVVRYQAVLRSYGGDPLSGRKLAARFAEAGVPAPEVCVAQVAELTGEAKLMPMLTVEATATAMSTAGIATDDEIAAAVTRLHTLATDETILIGSPRLFQAWARRSR